MNFIFHFSFLFYLLFFFISRIFSIFRTKVRVSDKDHAVTQQVTSDDTVTSHMTQKKDVEGSERMTSYSMLNTCWPYGVHMAV